MAPLVADRFAAALVLRRALAAVVALALLGSQSLSVLHYLLVPHHLCAEHGVLEEGTTSTSPDRKAHAAPTALVAATDDQDGHAACSVMDRGQHTGAVRGAEATLDTNGPRNVTTLGAGVEIRPERSALLAQAPKASPPQRA